MENEFISAPLLVNRSSPTYVDPKNELIKGLQLKNSKLKTELLKIQRAVEERAEQESEETPKVRQSLFLGEDNFEVLTKELANIYKRIKMYEYEVGKLEDSGRAVPHSQRGVQLELAIKQKKAMGEKLRLQWVKQQKIVQENIRRLQNGNQKEEVEQHLRKLGDEVKYLREKVKGIEQKEAMKAGNMKRQYEALKKYQNELLESGVAGGELEQMKQRAIRGHAKPTLDSKPDEEPQEQVEDRTRDRYNSLLNEVALLEKMHIDHQRQLQQAEDEKAEAVRRNLASRNRLLQCQNDIDNLEKQIQIIKNRVQPSNMKPLRPLRSYSHHEPPKSANRPAPAPKGLAHLLRFSQIGQSSSKGQRFSDRILLGRGSLAPKIVKVKVWIQKSSGLLAGIQVEYMGKKKGAEHLKRDREKEGQYEQQQLVCTGQNCLRSVSGTRATDGRLQSLLLTASDGKNVRIGNPKSVNGHFSLEIGPEEYPTCVFGSLLVVKQPGKKQISFLEHVGFQIQNENPSSRIGINEFNE